MAAQSTSRHSVNERFGLLPEPRGRFSSFSVSLAANVVLGLLFVWIAMVQLHKQAALPRYESTALVFQSPPPPPEPLPPVPKTREIPPVAVMAEQPRRIVMPKPQPEPPKPEVARLAPPAMPDIPAAQPKAAVAPPQPRLGLFASPRATAAANNQAAPTIQAGGFGNPSGAVVNQNAAVPSSVPTVGMFNSSLGADQGAGAAHRGAVQTTGFSSGVANGVPGTTHGAVVAAGFSSGVAGATPGAPANPRTVATGSFGNNGIGAKSATPTKVERVNFVAPEVISEPRPQYTAEARQLKIQGEVTLQVKFGADGKVEVLRVVNRLGHGLDEQAERAAQQIRFKPAAKDGRPVDQITLIHILFQLA